MTDWKGYPERMAALREQADLIEDVSEVVRFLEGEHGGDFDDVLAEVRQDRVFGSRPIEVFEAGSAPWEYGLVTIAYQVSDNTRSTLTMNHDELATLIHAGLRFLREHPAPVVRSDS